MGIGKLLPDSDDEDDDSDDPIGRLLKSNTAIFGRSEDLLKNGTLQYNKLRNANAASQHQSVVTCMDFHPTENLLLTSGLDRKAKLIQVRGRGVGGTYEKGNNYSQIVQQMFIEDLPIYASSFIRNGREAILSGNRKHFYSYDLSANRLIKQGAIIGHHQERNLSKLEVSPKRDGQFMAVACAESGYILVLN